MTKMADSCRRSRETESLDANELMPVSSALEHTSTRESVIPLLLKIKFLLNAPSSPQESVKCFTLDFLAKLFNKISQLLWVVPATCIFTLSLGSFLSRQYK